tara:strand:- start:511 stop:1344 length:834 start_codon:yes stop_codon:yes gene_type:complete
MKKIIWIASYPKSGNTWLRSILSSLFYTEDGIFNFKLLKNIPYFENKKNYEFVKNISKIDYNNLNNISVISKYRIQSQKKIKIRDGNFVFLKTHAANLLVNNYEYTNKETTIGLIYVVRDPRDVVISLTNHYGSSSEEMTNYILNERNCYISGYPHILSSWNHHYNSWYYLDVPKIIIKYEDMLKNIENIIDKLINFFDKNFNHKIINVETKVKNILISTNFNNLQNEEKKIGFPEAKNSRFFNVGKSKQWQNKLNKNQIFRIEKTFKKNMQDLNYL